jgi:putative transposase
VKTAFRFAIDHTLRDERRLRFHAGAARFAWNWGLARCKERYGAERKWYSAVDLHKLWNAQKKTDPALAWWGENSKCAYQEAFRNLDRALSDFIKSKKGKRKGKRLGFPKPKKKGRSRDSFRFGSGVMRCAGNTVTLPRLGTLKTHESTEKLAALVRDGRARILSATVSRTAQRWFVSFTVELDQEPPGPHARPGSAVGIDLGVKTLLTGVDDAGRVIETAGQKPLRAALRKLRRASRAHSRTEKSSNRRRKAAGRLARIHARAASVREEALHKATSELAAKYETVVAEDLNVTGMISNRKLARAVSDQGFGAARRMLAYKTERSGGTLIVADRWFPSSKTCSCCGSVKAKLTLKDRTFACDSCGHTEDRDVNAARNLLSLAASGAESLNARRAAVRPGTAGHAVLKREPGTPHGDKTGTAASQGTAAA